VNPQKSTKGTKEAGTNPSFSSFPSVNSPFFTTLGIDVGGTKIAAGLVTFPEGAVRARRQIATRAERGGEAVLTDVLRLARELASEAEKKNLRVQGVGLGVCELVNLSGEVVSAHCVAWQGLPVRERFATLAPTWVEADVRAAALAEALFGAGRGQKIFLYVTIGTGIASCLVIDGRPFTGARGATGTVASSPWPRPPEFRLPASSLEDVASGPALVRRFQQLHGDAQSGRDVLAAAEKGHAVALGVVRSAGEAVGATISLLVNVLDPESVIIGGGLGLSEGPYWESLVASARKHIWSDLHRDLPIVKAATGSDAGLIGAAAAVWQKYRIEN
jgi:glucokinase